MSSPGVVPVGNFGNAVALVVVLSEHPVYPRLGVIPLDWAVGSGVGFVQRIVPMLELLSPSFEVTLISLGPATDAVLERLSA